MANVSRSQEVDVNKQLGNEQNGIESSSAHPTFQFLGSQKRPFAVQSSEVQGTTLVTNERMPPGSLVFILPAEALLTYDDVCATPLSRLIGEVCSSNDNDLQISPEALTWLNMIVWLVRDEKPQSVYLKALSKVPPNGSSWPQHLQDELIGTNVYAVLDASGANNDTAGNVSIVQKVLTLLESIRDLVKDRQRLREKEEPASALALQLLSKESSIFTAESISWARGHFLSRRFPTFRSNNKLPLTAAESHSQHLHNHLAGYGGKPSMFVPVLDLMNHSPDKKNTCTLEMTERGVEIRTGELALEVGDELFYCYCYYGDHLSNEVLLQGYGFCLPDNPADRVCLKITTDSDGSKSPAFSIGRGGVSSIPSEMWKAIAGVGDGDGDEDEDQEIEIGSGDLERLLKYLENKLLLVNSQQRQSETAALGNSNVDHERRLYIDLYKQGQRQILEELIRDMKLMLIQDEEPE